MPTSNGREQVFNEGIKNNDTREADTTAEFLVTQNADGTQGKIETSTVIGGINIQTLVDNDPKTAFIDGSNSTVSIMEGSENNRTFGATVGDGEDVSSSLGVNNNYSLLQNAQLNKEATVGVELGLVKISQANPSGSTNISVDAPIANTNWTTPSKVAGDYVYASTSDIISGVVVKTTISAIRALSGTLDYSNFYTTDIGKEGNWYYDSTDSTTADNTGTVLVTSDGKRIKRIFDDFVNIEWFGAIGDNSTDNTSFIQNALNTTEKVFIPKGTFISSNLTLQNKQTLSGTGELSVLKFKTGSTGYFINGETRDGILITNLFIDGGNISDYSGVSSIGTRSGLYFTATNQNLKVDKCKITGFNAIAVGYNGTTSSANESISLSNNNISKNYCGISTAPSGVTHDTSVSGGAGGEYSKIIGNTFNLNRYAIVTSAGNTNVVGNNLSGNGYGIYSTSVSNVGHGNIVSNEINHSLLYSVYMQDNTIGHVISGNALYFGDLYFENCSGIIFTGNQVNSNVLTITGTGTYQNFSNNYFLVVPTFTGDFSSCLFSNNYGASGLFSGDFINNNSLVIDAAVRYGNAYNSVNNIVTNGTFATDTDWTKGTGWTISSGKANSTSSGTLSQSMTFVNGAYYVVEFDVSNFVSGNFRAGIGGITLSGFMSANGHKKLIIQKPLSGGNSLFSLVSTNFVGSIDNIVIYESLSKKLSVDNGIIISSETANTIASFDGTKNLKSLPLATYPSLTELSYGKGVTSAIQTQIDSKAPIANPALTGTPTAPTATAGTNTTQLATTAFVQAELDAEVNVQKLADNAIKSVTFPDGSQFLFFADAGGELQFLAKTFKLDGSSSFIGIGSGEGNLSSSNSAGTVEGTFRTSNGDAMIVFGGSALNFPTSGNGNISMPVLSAGDYTVSVAVTYTDATTVVKSSATLTTDYPAALPGDKVHCMSIIAGSLIYEKTATGWCQTSVTVVT